VEAGIDGPNINDNTEDQRRIRKLQKNNGGTLHAETGGFRLEELPTNDKTQKVRLGRRPADLQIAQSVFDPILEQEKGAKRLLESFSKM